MLHLTLDLITATCWYSQIPRRLSICIEWSLCSDKYIHPENIIHKTIDAKQDIVKDRRFSRRTSSTKEIDGTYLSNFNNRHNRSIRLSNNADIVD
ncbi:hypothetical protein ACHAXS_009528 [Conticribra weissflogii]